MKKTAILSASLCAFPFIFGSGLAQAAATTTATFQVSATVASSCSVTATALAFGTFTPGSDLSNSNSITTNCTNGTAYRVGLSAGNNATSSYKREMGDGSGNLLLYGICQDANCTKIWSTIEEGDYVSGTGTGSAQVLTAYGVISGEQSTSPHAGNYTDTITVTVSY
jgi:spore coat protein U-like protein